MGDVYGSTQTIDDLRDKVKAYLDALIIAMSSDSPKIEYAYDYHQIAALRLNGATVGITGAEASMGGLEGVSMPMFNYNFEAEVRVHTGYEGDNINEQTTSRLINSVANYFMTHLNMGDGYHITGIQSIDTAIEFSDSATVGGSIVFIIEMYLETYTQA